MKRLAVMMAVFAFTASSALASEQLKTSEQAVQLNDTQLAGVSAGVLDFTFNIAPVTQVLTATATTLQVSAANLGGTAQNSINPAAALGFINSVPIAAHP